MYEFTLILHNILRWVALILGIVATVVAFIGWFGKREWSERDRKLGVYYGISMDIQLLLGILLYFFLSPYALSAIMNQGMSYVMEQTDYRFSAFEHIFFMVLAVVFAHLGSTLAKKAPQPAGKFKRAAIFYALSLLLVLAATPWWRPLLRL